MFELILNVTVASTFISAFAGVLIWYFSFLNEKSKARCDTMRYCINRFREISECDKELDAISYLGLLNEEFYYIKSKLLDESVAREWLSGAIDYLPIRKQSVLSSGNVSFEIINLPLLEQSDSPFLKKESQLSILRFPLIANVLVIDHCERGFVRYETLEELYKDRRYHSRLRANVVSQMLRNIYNS